MMKGAQFAARQLKYDLDMARAKTPQERERRTLEEIRWRQNDPLWQRAAGAKGREQWAIGEEVLSRKLYGLTAEQSRWMEDQKVAREREGRIQRAVQPVMGPRGDLSALRGKDGVGLEARPTRHVKVSVNVSGSPEMMRELLKSPEGRRAFEDQMRATGLSAAYAP